MKTKFFGGLLALVLLSGISFAFTSERVVQEDEPQNSGEAGSEEHKKDLSSDQVSPFVSDKNSAGQQAFIELDLDKQIVKSVQRLLQLQAKDGTWAYEGVYRVRDNEGRRRIPVGYRIGGTSIVCTSLLYAIEKPSDELKSQINEALKRGTEVILKDLENPLMKPSVEDTYDVRVWGHIYALDYFCRLQKVKNQKGLAEKTAAWIPKLTNALIKEEIRGGGWNYANQRRHACFVTAPAVQALLLARAEGMEIEDALFERSANVLTKTRGENGAYDYNGTRRRGDAKLPGSIARSAGCETVLALLGREDQKYLLLSINAFHEHWDELEKRRQKDGTHEGPYAIAPYYFYFGHRYVSQAIKMLPQEKRAAEFKRFNQVLLRTLDADNTWNDRIFKRSKAYGTAMSLLALRTESVPLPEKVKPTSKKVDEPKKADQEVGESSLNDKSKTDQGTKPEK